MAMSLSDIAREVRIDVLRMFYASGTGHLAPALSCVDILVTLYFGDVIDWEARFTTNRDRVILSKGHGCAALYAVLARAGYFPRDELLTFYKRDSRLGGHPNIALPGIETATGALGHGICFATGTAKAAKLDGKEFRSYVIVGDGEMQEGSVWEAAQFAVKERLDNLTVIVDCNNLQASDWVETIVPLGDLSAKWESFGWNVTEADGHDFGSLLNALTDTKSVKEKPSIIIAKTIKGKGVPLAENNPAWHSRAPKGVEWEKVCHDLGIAMEDLKAI